MRVLTTTHDAKLKFEHSSLDRSARYDIWCAQKTRGYGSRLSRVQSCPALLSGSIVVMEGHIHFVNCHPCPQILRYAELKVLFRLYQLPSNHLPLPNSKNQNASWRGHFTIIFVII